MRTIKRLLQQAIPRTYWTVYDHVMEDGSLRPTLCIWKMWRGHSYEVVHFV